MTRAAVPRKWLAIAALAAAYFVAGKLGLRLALVSPGAAPIWPAAGIALAALLSHGIELWPAVLAGAFLVNLATAGSPLSALGIAIGSTLEAVAGAALVRRYAGGRDAFSTPRNILRFAALGGGVATMVSATLALASLALAGGVARADYRSLWLTWWLGDMGGALMVAPVALLWWSGPAPRWTGRQYLELGGLVGLLLLAGQMVFARPMPLSFPSYPLSFLLLPAVLWIALRFGSREAVTALLLLAGIAINGTRHGTGPFVTETPRESLQLLQAFLDLASITALVFGALVAERRGVEERLRRLSFSDPLTGLRNYRALIDALQEEIHRAGRTGRPFAVLLLDLDQLKYLNDQYGHLTGSRALCRVADVLRRSCRAVDTAARFGGDEFAVVLPEADAAAAWRVADRIRRRLEDDQEEPPVSVSFGVAVCPRDGTTIEELLGLADHGLYGMKARGA